MSRLSQRYFALPVHASKIKGTEDKAVGIADAVAVGKVALGVSFCHTCLLSRFRELGLDGTLCLIKAELLLQLRLQERQ